MEKTAPDEPPVRETPTRLEIHRSGFFGQVCNLLGMGFRGAALLEDGLELLQEKPRRVKLEYLATEVTHQRRFGVSSVLFQFQTGPRVRISFLKATEAQEFASCATEAWKHAWQSFLLSEKPEIHTLSDAIRALTKPDRFPAACIYEPVFQRAGAFRKRKPGRIPRQFADAYPDLRKRVREIVSFTVKPCALSRRERAIRTFVHEETRGMADFFDKVEKNPLTKQQREAVVIDEDATLVLAGAGSGKTSVIAAKAAYLVKKEIRRPEEILMIAFGKKAAEEMAGRVKQVSGVSVKAITFHALGYHILGQVLGHKPALADHATSQTQFRKLLQDLIKKKTETDSEVKELILQWFIEFHKPYRSDSEFSKRSEYYHYIEENDLRTLKGHLVKSYEEMMIANWLFRMGIEYEYEAVYKHELPSSGRKVYQPDFYLTESRIYIEHFGVRKGKGPDGKEVLTTASFVDRDEYLEGMEWKRCVHRRYGTTLVETFSYEKAENCLLENLEKKLRPEVQFRPLSNEEILQALDSQGLMDNFTQTLGTFLSHFKGSSLTLDACRKKITDSGPAAERSRAFLQIFASIFDAYQAHLGDRIDFDDMIQQATGYVRNRRFKSQYLHLLVDEFQDISGSRAKLVQALKAQHEDARIFAVGDDWQSIYRFAGSDINIMQNFGREFGGRFAGGPASKTVDLGRTFRSTHEIAKPARTFVLENPDQMDKEMVAETRAGKPAIHIKYYVYTKHGDGGALSRVLRQLDSQHKGRKKAKVLLLGRYSFNKPDDLKAVSAPFSKLDISFMTVHSSKGQEADHVVVLKLLSGRMGFPSEITDDPLLNLVLPKAEQLPHAEERRLFYVALTRARSSVTLLADQMRPSAFVRELVKEDKYDISIMDTNSILDRECPECGGRMLPIPSRKRLICEHRELCGHSYPVCHHCGKYIPGLPRAHEPKWRKCQCGAKHPRCLRCKDGWLVRRAGHSGDFYGCVRYPSCKATRPLESG